MLIVFPLSSCKLCVLNQYRGEILSRQVLSSQAVEEAPVELTAFARLMRAQSILRRELEAESLTPRGLTLNDFEALLHLSRAHEQRLRRVDLVQLLMLTPSGVTRLLEGLQEAGLTENRQCDGDARVTWAQLTREGLETLECVGASHTARLRALFRDTLSEAEVEQLAELLGRLPGVGPGSCAG
jgi:DNA-binding MarR family transcriptional regulator